MWNPKGNNLPKCLHPIDHVWKLVQYNVVQGNSGERVVELHQCVKCKRIKVEPLSWEFKDE